MFLYTTVFLWKSILCTVSLWEGMGDRREPLPSASERGPCGMLDYCPFPVTITESYTLFFQNGKILLNDLNKNHMY